MDNDTGKSSAPSKAVEKSSGNVNGTQAMQMLVKRQAEAAPVIPSAEHVEGAPAKADKPTTPIPAPSEGTPEASQPDKADKPEVKPETAEPEQTPPDEVLSQLSPEQRERIDRRIAKEVAKRKGLEDEINRLKVLANIAQQQTPAAPKMPVIETSPDNPLANVQDANELHRQKRDAEVAKDWAQEQLDRDDFTEAKVGDRTYSKADLKQVIRNSDKLISRFIPQRVEFLAQKANAERQTAEIFSAEAWMQDRTSQGYQAYQAIIADPDIAKRPNASWLAAIQVQGLLDVQRRRAASGKPAEPLPAPAKPKAPASQTATGGATGPSREAGDSKAVKELAVELERLKGKKGVNGRDVEAYLQKMEKARPTR